jgi:hypothetical protein
MHPESECPNERELVAQVRAELDRSEPDWLRIAALTAQAAKLKGLAVASAVAAGGVGSRVDEARARAAATLEEVRPVVAETDGLLADDNMARLYLDHAEEAYEKAVAAEAVDAAIDGFRVAVEAANAAHDHAGALRAQAMRKPPGQKAAGVFKGMLGRPSAPD